MNELFFGKQQCFYVCMYCSYSSLYIHFSFNNRIKLYHNEPANKIHLSKMLKETFYCSKGTLGLHKTVFFGMTHF